MQETTPLDLDALPVVGRDVYHDGQKVALAVDLTIGNTQLKKLREILEADQEAINSGIRWLNLSSITSLRVRVPA